MSSLFRRTRSCARVKNKTRKQTKRRQSVGDFFLKLNFRDVRVFASVERLARRRTSRSRSYAVRPCVDAFGETPARGDRAGVDALVCLVDARSRSCPSSVSGCRSSAAFAGSTGGAGEPVGTAVSARETISLVVGVVGVVARVGVASRAMSVEFVALSGTTTNMVSIGSSPSLPRPRRRCR